MHSLRWKAGYFPNRSAPRKPFETGLGPLTTTTWADSFGRGRSDQLLEARIIAERIEHWIEPEQRRGEWDVLCAQRATVGQREQFPQSGDRAVGFRHARRHPGKNLNRTGTIYRVPLDRIRGHRPFRKSQCGGLVPEAHVDER